MARRRLALALVAALGPFASPLWACSTAGTGAGCVAAPSPALVRPVALAAPAPSAPAAAVGEVLARGRHSILLNAAYYGLAPVSDGWVYMRVGRDLFRVDWRSHQVLERVTHLAGANF